MSSYQYLGVAATNIYSNHSLFNEDPRGYYGGMVPHGGLFGEAPPKPFSSWGYKKWWGSHKLEYRRE